MPPSQPSYIALPKSGNRCPYTNLSRDEMYGYVQQRHVRAIIKYDSQGYPRKVSVNYTSLLKHLKTLEE